MAVSKAPAPPPGLEAPSHMAQNLQAYAMQRPWTPMGGVPPVPVDPSMPRQFPPSAAYHPGYGGNLTGAAKAALNLFAQGRPNGPASSGPPNGPGPPGSAVVDQQERQRLEQAAKANARRLLNSTLTRPKAGTVQPPSAGEASETPSRDEPVQNLPNDQASQANQSVSSGPRYTGVLKVFKPESGYGFIECEELKKMYGCDVFMNQGIEGGILVGSEVSFTVELNKSGKPQAREARLEAEKSDLAEAGEPGGSNASGRAELLGKVFKGTVKSFNVARGFGFLTCPELKGTAFSGRDIYVSLAQVPDQRPLTTGHEVHFTLAVNQQGQPQGKDLKLMNSSPELDYLGELPTAQSVGDKLLGRVD